MPRVPVICDVETPQEVLTRYYPNGKLGGLTVDGAPPEEKLGQRVLLIVRVREPARSFELRGVLAWARRKGSKQLGACFGVDFDQGEDAARTRLLSFANNQLQPEALRVELRVQLALPVRVAHGGTERKEQLADLSTRGAFIRTRDTLEIGTKVTLSVRPPMSLLSIQLSGRIAWARRGGPQPGMGIEFTDTDGPQRARLTKLLARMARA